MKNIFIIALLTITTVSCNKEKCYSKKLMKGEYWEVKSVKIDGEESAIKGDWYVKDVDIYDTVSSIHWKTENYGQSTFQWQFQEKGKTYKLNYYQYCESCDGTQVDSMDYFTYAITGEYSVEKHRNKKMIFRSEQTQKYAGKEVVIEIEREK